jgi:hypothetical protein
MSTYLLPKHLDTQEMRLAVAQTLSDAWLAGQVFYHSKEEGFDALGYFQECWLDVRADMAVIADMCGADDMFMCGLQEAVDRQMQVRHNKHECPVCAGQPSWLFSQFPD